MAATDELVSSFDKSWKNFSKAWKEARATASGKSVHDLRVSTRRLIATLELTRALSKHDEIANLQRRFKKVLKRMGPLRDVQVQLETVSKMHQIGAIKEFERDLDRRERREIDSLSKELKRGRKQRLCKEVEDARAEFARLHDKLGDDRVRGLIERILKLRRNEFLKARRRFQPSDEDTLHEMRIAFKKFRYTVEAAQPVIRDSAKQSAGEMHAFQQLMGDSRDVEILRAELQKWSAKKGNIIATAPALERLEQKRESLLKKIIESSTAFEEKLQTENRPPLTETTRAVAAPAIAPLSKAS